jgi:MGT family glycosyltransferase
MTALLVSPDYVSHYLPLAAVGSALRDAGREVVVATGGGLRDRAEEYELAELRALCDRAALAFTRRFNETLLELAPDARPVESAFAAIAPRGTLVNYPRGLAGSGVARGAALVGPCVRGEPGDPELDARSPRRPRAYVALGSFLSARSDILRTIADALRRTDLPAVIASGVTPLADLGPLPGGSLVRPFLPQVAALRSCDVAVCHGGNNTAMEALTAGLPVVVLPFSTDQFAVAADLVASGLGVAVDPSRATAHDVVAAIRLALSPAMTKRAAAMGRTLRRAPGQERAAALLLRTSAPRRSHGPGTRERAGTRA